VRLPEIGLGIGRGQGSYGGWTQEWLYWYNQEGDWFPSPDERAEQAEQQSEQEFQQAEHLARRLREMGIDPDTL
jgi:hypothetical protein